MSERERALKILREARDLLSERLTQRVLEHSEQILDDARGDSYLGDIETTYEQFGTKLLHLNQLINNLPAEPTPTHSYSTNYTTSTDTYHSNVSPHDLPAESLLMPNPQAITGPLIVAPPALPAPKLVEAEAIPPSFQLYMAHIHSGDLVAAGRTLAVLLDLSEGRAVQCSRVFYRHWEQDAEFVNKALTLRSEVVNGSFNAALLLLAECFGLIGIEAMTVLKTLRTRLENA